jgi:DNA-binding NarL/FixJ family response regulator
MNRQGLKILIADDHSIVRAGVKVVLETQGEWRICAEAADGLEAVRLALEHKPDIVVIDYSLPALNGMEAARQIRKALPNAQVLIYTMHDDDMLIHEALKAGARGYILKSEEDAELIAGVQALAKGKTHFSQRVAESLLGQLLNGEKAVPLQTLTAREREVVQLVAEGQSNKSIAKRWGLSIKTVDTHRTSAMKKLNLRTAVDLARYAIRNKLIEP